MIVRRTATALAAVVLGLSTLTLGQSASAAPASPSDTVVITCQGKKVVKPKEIVMACGDGNTYVYKITWKSWTANRAVGTGTLSWNTCLPDNCSTGLVQEYKVRIVLGRVASGPGVTAFSRMTLRFPDGGPAMLSSGWYPLDNELG